MSYQRILVVQDISCVGQCSLTVALPILSACGLETAILPSAVLSTHTGGDFTGYTFRDLTDDIPAICAHWQKQGIMFDALYTGYLGSARQVEMVEHIMKTLVKAGGAKIVDPAMADNGRLYAGLMRTMWLPCVDFAARRTLFCPTSPRQHCSRDCLTARATTRTIFVRSLTDLLRWEPATSY